MLIRALGMSVNSITFGHWFAVGGDSRIRMGSFTAAVCLVRQGGQKEVTDECMRTDCKTKQRAGQNCRSGKRGSGMAVSLHIILYTKSARVFEQPLIMSSSVGCLHTPHAQPIYRALLKNSTAPLLYPTNSPSLASSSTMTALHSTAALFTSSTSATNSL